MKRKIVYIFPGYGESPYKTGYQQLASLFKRKHIRPIRVRIRWKYHTLTDYLRQFLSQYKPSAASAKIYLFGFSFGAMIALMAGTHIKPHKLYLCSLSPFFKEDLSGIKKTGRKGLGKKRLDDLKTISFCTLAKKISCSTILVAGDEELTSVLKRTYSAKKEIRKTKLYLAQGAIHDLSRPEYLNTLRKII